jgi:hypothetical protein
MPTRLTPGRVATPLAFVTALPTLLPFRVKATVRPLRLTVLRLTVADRSTVPPDEPEAGLGTTVVGPLVGVQAGFSRIDKIRVCQFRPVVP